MIDEEYQDKFKKVAVALDEARDALMKARLGVPDFHSMESYIKELSRGVKPIKEWAARESLKQQI